jgi:signal transduction histidine kinase
MDSIFKTKVGLSIRTTLILLLTGFTTALLIIVYAATTWFYASDQINQVDKFLIRESKNVHSEIIFPLIREQDTPASIMESRSYSDFLSEYLIRRSNLPFQFRTTLSIANKAGQPLASSNTTLETDLRELLASNATLSDQTSLGPNSFVVTVKNKKSIYRMLYSPIKVSGQQIGSIRIACLLDTAITNSTNFAWSTALFLLLAIVLNISGSIILVMRVLTPVREMSEAVEHISEQNLDQRLPILPGHDELSHLSITFNRALDRIANAWRFQEDLVNDLSHQLRTPLTTLRSSMELVLRQQRKPEEYRNVLEDSLGDIDHLNSLVNTMLTVARLEGSTNVLKTQPINPETMIRELCEELIPLWEDKGLKIQIDSDLPQQYQANIDRFYLCQAIINILDNAQKYSPVGGIIHLYFLTAISGKNQQWRLEIANDGPCIPEDSLERIFDRFYRSATETNSIATGFGLGLNIARRIIQLHGGSISARNRVGNGVVFELVFPGLVD